MRGFAHLHSRRVLLISCTRKDLVLDMALMNALVHRLAKTGFHLVRGADVWKSRGRSAGTRKQQQLGAVRIIGRLRGDIALKSRP